MGLAFNALVLQGELDLSEFMQGLRLGVSRRTDRKHLMQRLVAGFLYKIHSYCQCLPIPIYRKVTLGSGRGMTRFDIAIHDICTSSSSIFQA